jgi:hypothetical protein
MEQSDIPLNSVKREEAQSDALPVLSLPKGTQGHHSGGMSHSYSSI